MGGEEGEEEEEETDGGEGGCCHACLGVMSSLHAEAKHGGRCRWRRQVTSVCAHQRNIRPIYNCRQEVEARTLLFTTSDTEKHSKKTLFIDGQAQNQVVAKGMLTC